MDARRKTQTTVETRTVEPGFGGSQTLTREEELVIRMRHGLSEGPDFALEFRAGATPELQARLTLLEAHAISELSGESDDGVDRDAMERIIGHLSKLPRRSE